jgi:hypothetical protein
VKLTTGGNIYFPNEHGQFVSEKQRRISEILQEYDHRLEIQWIPPGDRREDTNIFRVVARYPNQPAYVVCFAEDCDERLLARVIQADQSRHSTDVLTYIDAHNAAVTALREKERQEKLQEAHEFAYAVMQNNKSSYKHRGVDFERPGYSNSGKTYIW